MFREASSQTLLSFYTDALNSAVFGTPVAYLDKYPITHYRTILESEAQLLKHAYKLVEANAEKPSAIKEVLLSSGMDNQLAEILTAVMGSKMADVKASLFQREINRGGQYLADHDWRIINIVTGHACARGGKTLINLSLILSRDGIQEKIGLDMNVHELASFINQLKTIQSSMSK